MTVLSRLILDGSEPEWYLGSVTAPYTPPPEQAPMTVTAGRRRRRSPSLVEQQRRTARIRPWAEHWKQLKAAGTWR